MAQIGVQYPDLAQMFGQYSLMPTELGMQRFEGAQKSEQLNQQQALQDILFDEQNNPLKLQYQGLQNQGLEAGLPGIFAESSLRQDKADVSRQSLGEQIAGAQSDGVAKMSDNNIKLLKNSAQRMAMSQDPAERAAGVEMMKNFEDLFKDREKQEAQGRRTIEQIRATGDEARKTQREGVELGRYAKGGTAKTIQDKLTDPKLSYQQRAGIAMTLAMQASTPEEAKQYEDMANAFIAQDHSRETARTAAGQVGKPDIGKLADIPVRQERPVQPFAPVVPKTIPGPGGVAPAEVAADINSGQATFSNPVAEALARQHAGLDNSAFFLEAIGGAYDPKTYDYRVGPGGKVQRKPKGK